MNKLVSTTVGPSDGSFVQCTDRWRPARCRAQELASSNSNQRLPPGSPAGGWSSSGSGQLRVSRRQRNQRRAADFRIHRRSYTQVARQKTGLCPRCGGSKRCKVRLWHIADIPPAPTNVRFWGNRGHRADFPPYRLMTQSRRAITQIEPARHLPSASIQCPGGRKSDEVKKGARRELASIGPRPNLRSRSKPRHPMGPP
jgi:hypothetical protein